MEHQDVVVLLKQQHEEIKGLFATIEAASGEARADAFQCLVRLLAVHETAEEEVVHPKARTAMDSGEAIVKPRLVEEDEAKTKLAELEKMGPDAPEFMPQLLLFRQAVLAHAEAEEHDEFPLIERAVAAEDRERLATMVETAEKMAPTHPHPHGPESAIGNMLIGPFVAIADRVRDAIRNRAA